MFLCAWSQKAAPGKTKGRVAMRAPCWRTCTVREESLSCDRSPKALQGPGDDFIRGDLRPNPL